MAITIENPWDHCDKAWSTPSKISNTAVTSFACVCRMTQTTELVVRRRMSVCASVFRHSVHAHSQVVSYCSDLGRDCTRSFTAWDFAIACAGKHIEHLPSFALVVLLVPDCVWNPQSVRMSNTGSEAQWIRTLMIVLRQLTCKASPCACRNAAGAGH